MWDLPVPGMEPVSRALDGRLFATEPPGKPCPSFLFAKSGNLECYWWVVCPWLIGFASQSFLICGVQMEPVGRDQGVVPV